MNPTEVIKRSIDHPRSCGDSWVPLDPPERFQVTYRLSIRQIKSHLERGFGLKLSSGAISGVQARSATAVKSPLKELQEWFKRDRRVKNVDETGWKIGGKRA